MPLPAASHPAPSYPGMTAAPDACADHPRHRRPAPARMRDVLPLFRFYRDATGLDGLIGDLDLTGVVPRQIYHTVQARPPESIETALADCHHDIADILAAALRSSEFEPVRVSVCGA